MAIDPSTLAAIRLKLNEFGESGTVRIEIVQDLIEVSACWPNHPQSPHPAPGWADHIVKGTFGWEVKFGANYFLIERAIQLCREIINKELDLVTTSGEGIDPRTLRRLLAGCIRQAVANYAHERFEVYPRGTARPFSRTEDTQEKNPREITFLRNVTYVGDGGLMRFGSNAIDIDAFIDRVCQLASLNIGNARQE